MSSSQVVSVCCCPNLLSHLFWTIVVIALSCLRLFFFFSSRRRHTRCLSDWSSDVCSSDLLRIHELKLPLNHAEPALRQAILKRLSIPDQALVSFTVFKRAYDARKTSAFQLKIGRASCRERV